MAHVKPILTKAEYEAALARLDEVLQAEIGTPDGDERDMLVDLLEDYERERFPIPPPTVIDVIEFGMDQQGLTARDLVPCIGSIEAVQEVLLGERTVTPQMAESLEPLLRLRLSDLLDVEEDPPKATALKSSNFEKSLHPSAGLQD